MNYIIKDNTVYRKGTLAHFLDKRAISIGEPTAKDLPATINPYEFVCQYLLKNNCAVIKLKHSEMKYKGELLGLINELVPAEQYIFIYIDVDDISVPIHLKEAARISAYPTVSVSTTVPLYIGSSAVGTGLKETCK